MINFENLIVPQALQTSKFRGEPVARINIEDEFFDDAARVGARMGDLDKATGQALQLIRFAQQQVKKGKHITYQEFSEKFSDMLMPEFARREGANVIVRGADSHFAWLKKKAEAGAKGGRSKTEAKVSKLKQNRSKRSTTEASFSSSSSSSASSTVSDSSSIHENPTDSKPQAFIAEYCSSFKQRWGVNPPIQGKDAGIAGRLAKGMSFERFQALLDAFFQMPDAWIVKNKHPLNLFEAKLNEIAVFADSGAFTTQRQAYQADDMATNHLLMEKLKREGK